MGLIYLLLLSTHLLSASVYANNLLSHQAPLRHTTPFESWLVTQQTISLRNLLSNISPHPSLPSNIPPGIVLASPSRQHPNYFYHWIRDAALTMSVLVDLYADNSSTAFQIHADLVGPSGLDIEDILNDYAALTARIQHTPNRSGSFSDGLRGLGEPKFEADGTAFDGDWGRPQHDGPALRAIALMKYLRAYNASHPGLWNTPSGFDFFSPLYEARMPPTSVIKADLEYTARHWTASGFDLWEEVHGVHFFTAVVQWRALREGAELAGAFGDEGARKWYARQAHLLEKGLMKKFWHEGKGWVMSTLGSERSGLDCAVLLGAIHGEVESPSNGEKVYAPWTDEVLASLLRLVEDQARRFPINWERSEKGEGRLRGVGIGRYPEDVYDGHGTDLEGGHPWFLCTSSAAEISYRTASHIMETGAVAVSAKALPFYEMLLESSPVRPEVDRTYGPDDDIFQELMERLEMLGDDFLEVVKEHVTWEGSLSEQFDRNTGFERGARDLTWSYGAFLQAVRARNSMWPQ